MKNIINGNFHKQSPERRIKLKGKLLLLMESEAIFFLKYSPNLSGGGCYGILRVVGEAIKRNLAAKKN